MSAVIALIGGTILTPFGKQVIAEIKDKLFLIQVQD